ncbi:MAG: hypothetical protein AB7S70_05435 [Hyphomicrobium sp.]|uniref:hypothetical protein n=1 Tax=Hyphomicrobium sp. TaxID=82 RepID=UPI003D0C728F
MRINWSKVVFWARRIGALVVGALAAFVIFLSFKDLFAGDSFLPWMPVVALATGASSLAIAIGLWFFPKRRRLFAAGLVGFPLSFPIGELVGRTVFSPGSVGFETVTSYLHVGGIFFFLIMTATAWLLIRKRRTSDAASEGTPTEAATEPAIATPAGRSVIKRAWAQRGLVSRGSYLAAGLWLLALLFVMVDSSAFVGDGGGFFAFLMFLLLPVAVLFAADWLVGKRRAQS